MALIAGLPLGLTAIRLSAQQPDLAPVELVGAIFVPGGPLRFDIGWVDPATSRYYLAEAGNRGVDVFDAESDLFLGRITGFHGNGLPGDPCTGPEGMGPSGVVVTPDEHLWAGDAHGTVKVFDLKQAEPPLHLSAVATISTGAECRADEVGYDPKDHVIVMGNPAEKPPYSTIISSEAPYTVLSKIEYPGATGLEQPIWDPELKGGRMLVAVRRNDGEVAVITFKDPKVPVIETIYPLGCVPSGLALGPSQHLLVGCSRGHALEVINATNGKVISTLPQIQGADEVWYNTGDHRFYAPSGFGPNPMLGIIDATTGDFIANLPAGPGAHSVAALAKNNHIFVPIGVPNPTQKDACNELFGFPEKQGCIFVYTPHVASNVPHK